MNCKTILRVILTAISAVYIISCGDLVNDAWDNVYNAGPHFMAVGGNGSVYISNDGITWSGNVGPGGTVALYDVTSGSGFFAAAGGDGKVYRSVDGTSWESALTDAADDLQGITYHNGIFSTCSNTNNRIWYSIDAVTWLPGSATGGWLGIGSGNGYFIAVNSVGVRARSTNGFVTLLEAGANLASGGLGATGVAYGNGVFIATADGGNINRSTDNLFSSTVALNLGSGTFRDAVYGMGRFVAVGYDASSYGMVYYSDDDGVTWNAATVPAGGPELYDVCYGNGVFVAVGFSGTIYYSNDGITWSENVGPGGVDNLLGVEFRE